MLREKLTKFKPKIAVFNGKAIYEVYSNQKKFMFGRQPEPLNGGRTWLWVMPSSSARCAQLPRAVDKVPFFEALRKFRDFLTGRLSKVDDSEVVFANVSLRKWENKAKDEAAGGGPGGGGGIGFDPIKKSVADEVDPNLVPWTDGVPAKVPQSVCDVIEEVVLQSTAVSFPPEPEVNEPELEVKEEEEEPEVEEELPVSGTSESNPNPEPDENTMGSVGSSASTNPSSSCATTTTNPE